MPGLELAFGLVQNVSSFACVGKRLSNITGYDWSIVKEVQKSATISGKDDLFLGSFDGGCEVQIVGFLELLACLILVSKCILIQS